MSSMNTTGHLWVFIFTIFKSFCPVNLHFCFFCAALIRLLWWFLNSPGFWLKTPKTCSGELSRGVSVSEIVCFSVCYIRWFFVSGGPLSAWQISGFMIKLHSKNIISSCFITKCLYQGAHAVTPCDFPLAWSMWRMSLQCSDMFPGTVTVTKTRRTHCPSTVWGSLLNTSKPNSFNYFISSHFYII